MKMERNDERYSMNVCSGFRSFLSAVGKSREVRQRHLFTNVTASDLEKTE